MNLIACLLIKTNDLSSLTYQSNNIIAHPVFSIFDNLPEFLSNNAFDFLLKVIIVDFISDKELVNIRVK